MSDLLLRQYNGHHCFIALTFDVYEDRHPMETPLHTEIILLVLSHIGMTFLEIFFLNSVDSSILSLPQNFEIFHVFHFQN